MKTNGFTLIELTVVIALISIMLVVTVPRFQAYSVFDGTKEVARWVQLKIPDLKHRAVREQKRYTLHISPTTKELWVTDSRMSEKELEEALQQAYTLPQDINLLDVTFPGREKVTAGSAEINFYPKGYSDQALIHLENNEKQMITFVVEPFLSRVVQHPRYVEFEN